MNKEELNISNYLTESARTCPAVIPGLPTLEEFPDDNPTYLLSGFQLDILHAAMGKVTEAGEFMDQLKKHLIYGAPLDHTNLKEEIGDGMWYDALALRKLGSDFETEGRRNIAKLFKRYPDKFDADHAINRDLDGEREVLEEDLNLNTRT